MSTVSQLGQLQKLAKVLIYLQSTCDLVLTLKALNAGVAEWWIDGAFGNHSDIQSHTGGYLSLVRGMVTSKSKHQKLNTRSSTEADLVAVDDCLPQVLWTCLFLISQGYSTGETIIRQDNKSVMLLAENGNQSSSQQTCHLNVRYYFVTNKITKGEIRIDHCGSSHMIADYFTKPLQGSLFKKFGTTF